MGLVRKIKIWFRSTALSADDYFLSLLASLPRQIAQRYRYQYHDGYAHAYADPYDFLVESGGRVTCKTTFMVYLPPIVNIKIMYSFIDRLQRCIVIQLRMMEVTSSILK